MRGSSLRLPPYRGPLRLAGKGAALRVAALFTVLAGVSAR